MYLAALELVVEIRAASERDLQLDLRVALAEHTQDRKIEELSVYTYLKLIFCDLHQLSCQVIIVFLKLLGSVVECVAGLCKTALTGRSVEELDSELLFQLRYVLTHCRLCDIALFCGLSEALAVGCREEKVKFADIHRNLSV